MKKREARKTENIKIELDGDELVIRIDLTQELGRSKSGKSINVASTFGNISIPGHPDIQMGLNLYKKVR